MSDTDIKTGMKRKGYTYQKDLSKMGKDFDNQPFKGGFEDVDFMPIEQDEDEFHGNCLC